MHIVLSGSKSRLQNTNTALLLGIVCLVPPWVGAVFKAISESNFYIPDKTFTVLGVIGWLLVFLMYLLLYLIGRNSERYNTLPTLRLVSKEAKNRSIFFAFIVAFDAVRIFAPRWPLIPAVLILGVYVLVSFNQDRVIHALGRLPGRLQQR